MRESEAFYIIAERFLEGAKKLVDETYEVSGFLSYHAFESLGGALCTHLGRTYPKSHPKKLKVFVQISRRFDSKFAYGVANITLIFESLKLREKSLYPSNDNGHVQPPKDIIKKSHVKKLISKVNGIKKRVKKEVGIT